VTVDYLWEELSKHDTNDQMLFLITLGTSDQLTNECGLSQNHAYVVLGTLTLSNNARLVRMRNPWGNERYFCDYSDKSDKWTPQLRQEAGATQTPTNDGLFFMTIEDYHR